MLRPSKRLVFRASLLLAGLAALHTASTYHPSRIDVIKDGKAYRSGQLSASQLATMQTRYGIKSIINLRGANYKEHWYQEEVTFAKAHNLAHYDYPLSSKRPLTLSQEAELVQLMAAAPKPVLVHCDQGLERTGTAAALYVAKVEQGSRSDALQQLTLFAQPPLSMRKE